MIRPQHARLAIHVIAIYWLMLLGGLVLFTVARAGDVLDVGPLWLGAIGGTLLGQYFALNNFRFWIVALLVGVAVLYCRPLLPSGDGSDALWQAFVPAALCGFWSLGDRAVLAAAWFPTVLWMLAILDRNDQELAPDGVAAVLLGVVAVLFIAFLRARESRRVGLWRSVAPGPVAPSRPVELLRESPASQLARGAWGLSIGAIASAVAVWLAPPLWRTEVLGGNAPALAGSVGDGPPCCPRAPDDPTESSRVKEYLDLGLGHGERTTRPHDDSGCRVCPPAPPVILVAGEPGSIESGEFGDGTAVPGVHVAGDPNAGALASRRGGSTIEPTGESTGVAPSGLPLPAVPDDLPPTNLDAPTDLGSSPEPSAASAQDSPPREPLQEAPSPEPRAIPGPTTAPAAAPTPSSAPAVAPTRPYHATPPTVGPSILGWLALVAIAALVAQGARFALRPLRRLVTLRHLRRPFWDETIDQRVSNSWQLALIGLRDAGWRAGPTEAPQELARRAGVDGLARCATILERARHGVGIDADDLADMRSSANVAYRAARTGLGSIARAIGWLRWPLT